MFSDLMDDFEISHGDVHMSFFVQTLRADAREWFLFLPACLISSWSELYSTFMMQFCEKVSIHDAFTRLLQIRIGCEELVPNFSIRFGKALNEIPHNCRPNDQVCVVIYFDAFDGKMNYLLQDKEPKTLQHGKKRVMLEVITLI